jgi:hypothetical protein
MIVQKFCFLVLLFLPAFGHSLDAFETCPRTLGPPNLIAEAIFPDAIWYGSEALAVALKPEGYWIGMGSEENYRDKLFWWSHGYSAHADPYPALIVTGRRLDAISPPAEVSRATNVLGSSRGRDGMLLLVSFPSEGCWEIRGTYKGQELQFIVQVGQERGLSDDPPN